MKNKKIRFLVLLILIFAGLVLTLRLTTDEDTGICNKGNGIKHGNPNSPMPITQCSP